MEKLAPSFGRRKARKLRTQAQQAYTEKLARVRIRPEREIFDLPPQEIWLEIGFGGGEHFLAQLAQHPKIAIIGCEPFINGVAKFLKDLSEKDMPRVRIWPEDVRYLLERFPPAYISRVFILFPDPWPKKRHQRRRLVSQSFLNQLLPTLKGEAELYIASDDVSYVEHIQQVFSDFPIFRLKEGPCSGDPSTWGPRPSSWPSTRYEQKALELGKPCAYMIFKREGT